MGLLSYFFPDTQAPVAKDTCYHIEGFLTCAYFHNALSLADQLDSTSPRSNIQVEVNAHPKSQWKDRLDLLNKEIPGSADHRTSPVIWEGCEGKPLQFVGGYDNFLKLCIDRHSPASRKNV